MDKGRGKRWKQMRISRKFKQRPAHAAQGIGCFEGGPLTHTLHAYCLRGPRTRLSRRVFATCSCILGHSRIEEIYIA
jgi:hypothetical protein